MNRFFLAALICAAALCSCSLSNLYGPGSMSYLSGNHSVYYTVDAASGGFVASGLSATVQTDPAGATTDFAAQALPFISPTYTMDFSGTGAYIRVSASDGWASGSASLTMSVWIDGVQAYTATGSMVGSGSATVSVSSPYI